MISILEEWKVIENAPNYEISNCGEVRNKITTRILKSTLVNGYLATGLRINNKKITTFIHRLVATCFLVCPDEAYVVNHKDGIKTNNIIENLEWISQSANSKHAYSLNLRKSTRIGIHQYKLDNVFVREYESLLEAEKETGVFNGHISKACRGVQKTAGGYIWKYANYIPTTQSIPQGKTLIGYPNYIITTDGKVYNSQRNRFLALSKYEGGYIFVCVSSCNEQKIFSVHRLVASHFIANPNNYSEVNHIDFDKTNNNVDNLEWVSRSDNMKHNLNKGGPLFLSNNPS